MFKQYSYNFLRLLLLHQHRARSFEELKTVDNRSCNSFREVYLALNLLDNDEEWDRKRQILKYLGNYEICLQKCCVFCNPSYPIKLWEKSKELMCDPTDINEFNVVKDAVQTAWNTHGKQDVWVQGNASLIIKKKMN